MKYRRFISLLLVVVLLLSSAVLPLSAADTHSSRGINGYYNVDYLENYAAAAYGEEGLGAVWSEDATTFKVWSPEAKRVQVRLYKTGSDEEDGAGVIGTYSLTKNEQTGVWSVTLSGDYKNVYYTYLVTARGKTCETRDIYAKAAGVNGYRSMVVDLDETDPEGWDSDQHQLLDKATDAVIWEVHIRDFSIDPSSGVSEANRGKYLAFTEDGTHLSSADELSTCVDYLKEMGVNTVHLLPAYDFGSVDETVTDDPTNRNWGYDPINYNVPEGSYSTDPYDGNVRIREFKEMVQALHKAGISVVMDVVYNHTYDVDSYEWGARLLYNNAFNDTVPGYYFRMEDQTNWYNGSGCGNVTASDKLMFRKYMVESVRYWATEYHIDGFRFDLMGCHDVDTMNLIRAELDKLDGGEKILMYGEPWTGGNAGIANGATQNGAQTYGLNERIGMFCDWMRDAIKGNPDGDTTGWIQGNTANGLTDTIWGGLNANDGRLTAKTQTVTYADAHDNLILWDKVVRSNGSDAYTTYTGAAAETYLKQLRLAEMILMVSQGLQFQVAGTEFARNKQGNHNSYNAPDDVNAIDWSLRETNRVNADYYKGLIAIRKAFEPFTEPKADYVKTPLEGADDNCIAFSVDNEGGATFSKLVVILNNSAGSKTVTLPEGSWYVFADGQKAGLEPLDNVSGSYTVPGFSGAILGRRPSKGAPVRAAADDYYLIGYINGANYGCEDDYANLGEYKFEDGKLSASFTQDSYVFVKTGDNNSWFMTDGWLGTSVTSATLYNTATHSFADKTDKFYVPGGKTLDFTLEKNADDSLTLSYTVSGGTTPIDPPTPSDTKYYLTGDFADWSAKDQYLLSPGENAGEYVIQNVYLAANAGVKVTSSDGKWYPDGMGNEFKVKATGSYDVSFYPAGGQTGYHEGFFLLTKAGGDTPIGGDGRTFADGEKLYVNVNGGPKATDETTGETAPWWDKYGPTHKMTLTKADGSTATVTLGFVEERGDERVFQARIPAGTYVSLVLERWGEGESAPYNVSDAVAIPETGNYLLDFPYEGEGAAEWGSYDGPAPQNHENAKDAIILHAWCWSYQEIIKYLPQIKAAGYTAVQTSPAQVPKNYDPAVDGVDGWWKLYQPVSFCIAPQNTSWLGGKEDLQQLCTEAHKLGIEVIVDVVANHMSSGWDSLYAEALAQGKSEDEARAYANEHQATTLDAAIAQYEPEIYNNKLYRDYIEYNDYTTEGVTWGNIGMPDLLTEDERVQKAVADYLVELVDVGVDGFRFDAVKHIGTPYDEAPYTSDFWPVVLGAAQKEAAKNGTDVWYYGEIFMHPGGGRFDRYYTHLYDADNNDIGMAITDFAASGASLWDFNQGDANKIANLQFVDYPASGDSTRGEEPLERYQVVLFPENHDQFTGDAKTYSFTTEKLNKAWAIEAARADISALYFARPKGYNINAEGKADAVGTMGLCQSFEWMNPEVAEINKFHNDFVGADEFTSAFGTFVIIERYGEAGTGAVVVNAGGTISSLNGAPVDHLADGSYYDQITGETFTVANGKLSGSLGTTGIAVLRTTEPTVCDHSKTRTETTEPTCTEPGWTLTICEICYQTISKVQSAPALGHADTDKDGYCDRCGEYLNNVSVYFVDTNDWVAKNNYYDDIRFYAFDDAGNPNAAWPGLSAEWVGRTADEHGIWKAVLNPEKYSKVIFNAGENGMFQTPDLPFKTDADGSLTLVYQADSAAGSSEEDPPIMYDGNPHFTGETKLYIDAGCIDWWTNDNVIQRLILRTYELNPEDEIDVSVDLERIGTSKIYGAVIPEGSYRYLTINRVDPNNKTTIYNSTGNIAIPIVGNLIKSFEQDSSHAEWGYYHEVVGGENGVTIVDLADVCAHSAYEVVRYYNQEVKVCDCCGARFDVIEVEPDDAAKLFVDVQNPKSFFTTPVYWAVALGVTNGVDATHFGPGNNCTRGQVVTFLWRAAGQPKPTSTETPFTDIKAGAYYYDAVLWAVEKGITNGTGATTFGPNASCTRGQIVTFLYRYAGSPEVTGSAGFSDVSASAFYAKPVTWAVQNGITNGTSATTFAPGAKCTRGQVVTFLYRLMTAE